MCGHHWNHRRGNPDTIWPFPLNRCGRGVNVRSGASHSARRPGTRTGVGHGGFPRLATTMTRALARRGHHVTVCTTDVRDERSAPGCARGPATESKCASSAMSRTAWRIICSFSLRSASQAPAPQRRVLRCRAPARLPQSARHAGGRRPRCVPACRSSSRRTAPGAIERRVLAKRIFAATAGRHVLTGAARVLAVTDVEQEQLLALGVPRSHISVVPNPDDDEGEAGCRHVEIPVRRDSAAPSARRRAHRAVSRQADPAQGSLDLIRAFARLNRPDTVLVIAGNDMGSGRRRAGGQPRAPGARYPDRAPARHGPPRRPALRPRRRLSVARRNLRARPLEALLCGTPVVVCGDSGCGEVIGKVGRRTDCPARAIQPH